MSIRRFLVADGMDLLDDFEENLETIKDVITATNAKVTGVDDMPYLIAIGMDIPLDLEHEYAAITTMYNEDSVTAPIQAFSGTFSSGRSGAKATRLPSWAAGKRKDEHHPQHHHDRLLQRPIGPLCLMQ